MTTIDTHAPGPAASVGAAPVSSVPEALMGDASGIAGWLTTTDHKRIGRLYVVVSSVALLGVSAVGLLLGIERADASGNFIDAGALPQLFSAYRVGLTFVVLVPLLLGLATAIVPLQLGARSLAFPRLAAGGFWTWLVGAVLVVGTIAANGGPGGGDQRMVAGFLVAHVLVLLGLLAGAVSLAASVLTTRAPGMNMRRVPLFSWSVLVGAVGLVIVLPVVVGALVYTYVDFRYGGTGLGGNRHVMDLVNFGFTQPQTLVYAIPAFGIAAEVVAVATRRRMPMRGVVFAGIGLVAVAALGGVIQSDAGVRADVLNSSFGSAVSDLLPYALLNLLPVLGALIVLAIVALALTAGRPRLTAPLVLGLLGALMVFVGMLGNALYQIGDAHLAGTVFEEGAWIYVAYGSVLCALGGVAHWGPKLWGRSIPTLPTIGLALLGLGGTVLASLPYYVAGFADQPALSIVDPVASTRFDYSGPQDLWNALAAIGHGLMLLTVVAFAALALRSFTRGKLAGDDPWDGQTLEWATSSPAPYANFSELHVVASPEPLLDLKPQPDTTGKKP